MERSSYVTLIVALATSAALGTAAAIVAAQPPPAQTPAAPPAKNVEAAANVEAPLKRTLLDETHMVGVGSCAASGCHGGAKPMPGAATADNQAWRSSYIVWATSDPHARAYQTLKKPEAMAILRKLDRLSATDKVAPHEDRRCTTCHATASPHGSNSTLAAKSDTAHNSMLQSIAADGVSCESCHGAAKQWVGEHFLMGAGGPAPLPADDLKRRKAKLTERGMLDTDDLAVQAETCVRCHVGDRSDPNDIRDMNHDMIAAGHPALNFEFAAYKARMPRHWAVPTDGAERAERELLGWLVGQSVSAAAALRLSAHRAEASFNDVTKVEPSRPHVPWPEFSEYSCYRCHHALRSGATADPTVQQQFALDRKRQSSVPIGDELWRTWGAWNWVGVAPKQDPETAVMLKALSPSATAADVNEFVKLQRATAAKLDASAAEGAAWLDEERWRGRSPTASYVYGILRFLLEPTQDRLLTWEEATRSYLLSVVIYRGRRLEKGQPLDKADDETGAALKALYHALRFDQPGERRFNSPANYDPAAVKKLFETLWSAMAKEQ